MERVKLKVIGVTSRQVRAGAYALLLAEEGGHYRIPIVIGVAEAQSIAIKLENITPQRPLPHDLFVSFSHAFGIELNEVFLYKYENGMFMSELKFNNDDRQVVIDSRTSDAVALALRTGAPIYTTREILEQTGYIPKEEEKTDDAKTVVSDTTEHKFRLEKYAIEELEKMLSKCVEREEYERAAEIKKLIAQKREQHKDD